MIERVMGNAWFGAPGENTQFHESNISQHTSLHAEHSTASCAPHILHAEHSTSARHRSPSVLGFLAQKHSHSLQLIYIYIYLFSQILGALFRVFAKNCPAVTRETSTPNCGTPVLRTAPGGFGIRGGVWYPSDPLLATAIMLRCIMALASRSMPSSALMQGRWVVMP